MSQGDSEDARLARALQQQDFARSEVGRSSVPDGFSREEYYQTRSYQASSSQASPGTIPMPFGETLNPPPVHVSSLYVGGHQHQMFSCHRLSRVLRVISIIDGIVVVVGSFFSAPLILMIWGPISGYLASSFQLKATYLFLLYYLLRVGWDIGWLIVGGVLWFPVWVFLITDLIVLHLVFSYFRILSKCSPAEVEQMRDPRSLWGRG